MKRAGIVILTFIVIIAGWRITSAILKSGSESSDDRPPVPVVLADVQHKNLEDVGNFTGSLLPRSQFYIAPKIGGRLETVLVDIGDEVSYNQLIAVLDDDEYVLQVDRARANLAVAKASLEQARSSMNVSQRELERIKTLFDKDIAAESDYDIANDKFTSQKARYEVAEAEVDQEKAALEEAQVRLSYTQIRATWEASNSGVAKRVVGERFRDEGSMLSANTPIVSILDINTLLAVVYVIERDYTKIQIGMPTQITTDAYPDKIFSGTVSRIAPRLEETSRQARTEIEIKNTDRQLKPGMFVRVEMTFGEHENVTVVPTESIARRDGNQGVFLADTDKMTVRYIPVKQGISAGEETEILEPQISGKVVLLGQHLLEDGAPIKLAEEAE